MIETAGDQGPVTSPQRPQPMQSLLASAKRLTSGKGGRKVGRSLTPPSAEWQADAWDMYDLVGEQRFLTTTIAGRLSQARFVAGQMPEDPTGEVEELDTTHPAAQAFRAMSGRPAAFVQMIYRLAINLAIPGEGYLVGIPHQEDRQEERENDPHTITITHLPPDPFIDGYPGEADGIDNTGVRVEDLDWHAASLDEIEAKDGEVHLNLDPDNPLVFDEDEVYLIRVWRPHPRKWYEPDSPTRSSLPVLRELVALTMDISAKVDSRLAGAGMLLVPEEASQSLARADADDSGDGAGDGTDPLTEALIEAMTTPISDRSSAAAVVPLVVTVPGDSIDKFRHISFHTPEDGANAGKRDEAIRRLALGQDCPPELLLGVGSMNHWGAWLVQEDVVTTHIEPILALICDSLTTEYLWPVLTDPSGLNMDPEEARKYVVWYNVDHLITQPNRGSSARDLHAAGVINDKALREAHGYDDSDAPEEVSQDRALELVLTMVSTAPSLAAAPGIPVLLEQVRAALGEGPADALEPPAQEDEAEAEAEGAEGEAGIPDLDESAGPEDVEDMPE